jgi:hypothetical protein
MAVKPVTNKRAQFNPYLLPGVILLVCIPLLIFFISSTTVRPKLRTSTIPSTIPTTTISTIISSTPGTQIMTPTTISLPADPQLRLLYRIEHRTPLSPTDSKAKQQILSSLSDNKSGIVYSSSALEIDYVSTEDVFQGEILSVDIEAAKQEATQWFLSKGMSHEGVCNNPVEFYLNKSVSSSLGNKKADFNPLPPGC